MQFFHLCRYSSQTFRSNCIDKLIPITNRLEEFLFVNSHQWSAGFRHLQYLEAAHFAFLFTLFCCSNNILTCSVYEINYCGQFDCFWLFVARKTNYVSWYLGLLCFTRFHCVFNNCMEFGLVDSLIYCRF